MTRVRYYDDRYAGAQVPFTIELGIAQMHRWCNNNHKRSVQTKEAVSKPHCLSLLATITRR